MRTQSQRLPLSRFGVRVSAAIDERIAGLGKLCGRRTAECVETRRSLRCFNWWSSCARDAVEGAARLTSLGGSLIMGLVCESGSNP